MKTRLRLLIGIGVITPLIAAAPYAVARGESTTTTSNTTNSSQTSSSDDTQTQTEKTEMNSRLEQEKTELKIKLGAAELAAIKTKCTPAQSNIKSLSTRFLTNVPQRTKAYEELSSHISTLLTKLQAKGVDVTELQSELTTLQGKITTYKTDLDAYKQALSDAKNVDCNTDPSAFKAALETARTARDKVMKDITDIKTYVTNTIKPTLVKIRTELEAQEKASGSDNSTNTTTTQGGNQ